MKVSPFLVFPVRSQLSSCVEAAGLATGHDFDKEREIKASSDSVELILDEHFDSNILCRLI